MPMETRIAAVLKTFLMTSELKVLDRFRIT